LSEKIYFAKTRLLTVTEAKNFEKINASQSAF